MSKQLLRNFFPLRGMLALAAVMLMAAGCNNDSDDHRYGGIEQVVPETEIFITEATGAAQSRTIDDPKTALPVTVCLGKALSTDVSFTLDADAEWVDNYNEEHGTDWILLPAAGREMTVKRTIPAGATTSDPIDLKVTLPDDANAKTYVLPVYLADVAGAAEVKESQSHLVYLFVKGNFVYIEQAASGAETIAYKVEEDNPVTLPVEVSLVDAISSDMTITLKVDEDVLNSYNALMGTNYATLPAEHYTWASNGNVTIAAGSESASADIVVNSLPEEGMYAIGLSISAISGGDDNIRIRENQSQWVYLLRRSTMPAIQKSAVITGFTAANQTAATLNLGTYSTWTIEYWIRYDDISSYKSQYDVDTDWLSSASGQGYWRRSVYSPQNVPVGLPSPMNFMFWPQADQPVGPQFQLTQGEIMSASTSNGGYNWRPDTWAHLVFTYDGANVRYYINGVIQKFGGNTSSGQQTLSGETAAYANATSWNSIAFVKAGNNATYVTTLQIEMAQMRLWSRALGQTEIAENMGMTLSVEDCTGLVGYWKMDEGEGTTLYDSSGNGNDIKSNYIKWSESTYNFSNNNGN